MPKGKDEKKESQPKPIHSSHRARMQERVRKTGLESMAEHEVLEYLLFFSIPRQDTNPLAHRLIEHFGGFCKVMEADEAELLKVEGIGPASARLLVTMREVCGYYTRHKDRRIRKPLNNPANCTEYVTPLFFGKTMECFYMIALDEDYIPLRDVLIGEGLPNQVSFDTRKLAREAVASGCSSVLLTHNHPNSPALLSNADFASTCSVIRALGPIGIDVVDHVIIGSDGSYSMQQSGRLPYYDNLNGTICY